MSKPANVVLIDASTAGRHPGFPGKLTRGEVKAARHLADQHVKEYRERAAAERRERRQGSTVYRLRRHLWPWHGALTLLGLAVTLWVVDWVSGARHTGYLAACTAAVGLGLVGLVAAFARSLFGSWRRRVLAAAAAGLSWLTVAVWSGPSYPLMAGLVALTLGFGARWWRAIRIGYATDNQKTEPTDVDSVVARWGQYIGSNGGPLPESLLTEQEATKAGETYTVNLAPGKQTLSTALSVLDRISSGLDIAVRNLVLESHPSESPSKLRLTVLRRSPIAKTVVFDGPVVENGVISLGPYGDGDGSAPWRLWTPGDAPHEGSWWGGLVIGGMGIGKSRKLELISISAMATGFTVVWFIDPQGGASSPALRRHADWYTDVDGSTMMLGALERIADWRGKENAAHEWIGFDPSPARPGILVMIDEAHEVFARDTERWATLARKSRKVGIGLGAFSQYPGLSTFAGSEPLRSAIMGGNAAVMYAASRQNGQLMPGLTVDPLTLPKVPGFSYILASGSGGRTAPFRDRYVTDPAAWMAKYPQPPLDQVAARAAGAPYADRREKSAADMRNLKAQLEAMRNGSDDALASSAAAAPLVVVPEFPSLQPSEPDAASKGLTGAHARVWDAIGAGELRYGELLDATGWSKSRLTAVLRDMVDAGHLVKEGHGRYRHTDGP